MGYVANTRLNEIANEIKKRKSGEKLTVRDFLGHFGITRRKVHVRWWIDKWLSEKSLVTTPDYKTAWIDGQIELREATNTESTTMEEKEDFVERLRILNAANRSPSFVTRDDSLVKATTIMAQNDFSQLPVMAKQDARSVDGII
jgi:CBS domain-containing protein